MEATKKVKHVELFSTFVSLAPNLGCCLRNFRFPSCAKTGTSSNSSLKKRIKENFTDQFLGPELTIKQKHKL